MAFASASSAVRPPAPGAEALRVCKATRTIELRSATGERHVLADHPVFDDDGPFVEAVCGTGRAALLGRRRGGSLFWFDLESGVSRVVPLPERLPRAEELTLHGVRAGFLVISENGVLAIDSSGGLLWQLDEVTFGARLVASTEDAYWIEDTGGNLVAIDPRTGGEAAID